MYQSMGWSASKIVDETPVRYVHDVDLHVHGQRDVCLALLSAIYLYVSRARILYVKVVVYIC